MNVHSHTDDCYENIITYSYWTAHDVKVLRSVGHDWEGTEIRRYKCNYCKKEFENSDPGHYESTTDLEVVAKRKGEIRKKVPSKELACGKEEGQLMGYETDCGFVHGQVVAAKISFAAGYEDYDTIKENDTPSVLMSVLSAEEVKEDESVDEAVALDGDEPNEDEPETEDKSKAQDKSETEDDTLDDAGGTQNDSGENQNDADVISEENTEEQAVEQGDAISRPLP